MPQTPRPADLHVALVTTFEALPLDEDLPPLVAALEKLGVRASTPCWDDEAVDWSQFDVALLRSTWNYAEIIRSVPRVGPPDGAADAAAQSAARGGMEH